MHCSTLQSPHACLISADERNWNFYHLMTGVTESLLSTRHTRKRVGETTCNLNLSSMWVALYCNVEQSNSIVIAFIVRNRKSGWLPSTHVWDNQLFRSLRATAQKALPSQHDYKVRHALPFKSSFKKISLKCALDTIGGTSERTAMCQFSNSSISMKNHH